MKKYYDCIGHELNLGDTVYFMQVGYRTFIKGKIKSMAPKSCMIEHEKTNVCSTESRQAYGQIFLDTKGWKP